MVVRTILALGVSAAALTAVPSFAQNVDNDGSDGAEPTPAVIIVSGSRLSDTVATYPGSVSVVSEETIEQQLAVTRDISKILSAEVPGIAPGNDTAANVDQTLRGRPLRIFVDGIPISNPLRDGGRDVRLIAPTALGGIEVIRGASALYGQGGAGGVVNYITKNGSSSDDWAFRSEVGTSFSTEHVGDSFRPFIFQSATGGIGDLDVNLNGSYEWVNSQFDANGERLPPDPNLFGGIADSEIVNLYGKIGYSFGGTHRFEAMVNYYDQKQDTDRVVVPGDIALGIPATSEIAEQDPRALDQVNRNLLGYFAYSNSDILGSSLRSQIYYVENKAVFAFEPGRLGGTQTSIDSEKFGLQTDVKTYLDGLGLADGLLLWGFDINRDTTEQPLIPLTEIDGRTFAPPMQQTNYAAFVQANLPLTDWLTLRAGVRHDEFELKIDSFIAGLNGQAVSGGTLKYSATPINIGATFEPVPGWQVFGGFSQGFSVPDVGSIFRRAAFDTVEALKPRAAMVDNYEIGTRFEIGAIKGSLAYYVSKSKLGSSYSIDPANPTEVVISREAERIQGVEATLGGAIGGMTNWGLTFAYATGERDSDGDGKVDAPLSGRRVPPVLVNGYLAHEFTDTWDGRIQFSYTGDRDKFPDAPIGNFYEGAVEDTFRVDASTSIDFGLVDLTLGISNIFNADYYTVTSQMLNRNDRYAKALGRTVFIKVGFDY